MTTLDLRLAPVDFRLHHGRSQAVKVGLCVGVWAMPLLVPPLPGNSAPADLAIGAAICFVLANTYRRREAFRLPYAAGSGLMILAGALAALLADPPGGVVTLAQDLSVLLWAAALANAGRDPGVLRAVTRAWAASGCTWATVLVVSYFAGVSALSGVNASNGSRASFLLGDPNVAGNYFVVSVFVLLACGWPVTALARWGAVGVLVLATALTGSNGAMLSLLLGSATATLLAIRRRGGLMPALAVASALGLVVLFGHPHVDVRAVQARAAASIPLLKDSVGRSGESSSEREKLLAEGARLYWSGDLVGIGPGRTKATLAGLQAPYVKEAHDDYLATVVERGVAGGLGLVLLIATVTLRAARVVSRPRRADFGAVLPRPEMLAAAAVVMLFAAFFYEVLHFRHLWALLGILAAMDLWGRR